MSLLWRVFIANAAVLVVGVAALAWTPVTVRRVATPSELVVLALGLVVMLAADIVLLRRAFRPLRQLAAVMGGIDPVQPGRRAEPSRRAGREVVALAEALNSMLDRMEDEHRESARRALAAQEQERSRIARELHDEVGQTLTAVALRAERAATSTASSQHEALMDIAEIVACSLEDVHRIGRELRPEALDDLGLVNALLSLCSRITQHDGLRVRSDLHWRLPILPSETELVIYRVAQEALTNAARHSGGTEALVTLTVSDKAVVLLVADDGRGLPARRVERGLAGMRERALLIDAELNVCSRSRRGTEVVLTVPVTDRR
jgi:two-component system sensor histidine kinase UhpB